MSTLPPFVVLVLVFSAAIAVGLLRAARRIPGGNETGTDPQGPSHLEAPPQAPESRRAA